MVRGLRMGNIETLKLLRCGGTNGYLRVHHVKEFLQQGSSFVRQSEIIGPFGKKLF